MKKKLYLHIGMGKTGTTALQNFFWDNRKLLAKRDICYPRRGTMSHAHHLLSPHIPRFLEGEWDFEKVEQWAPDLVDSPQNRILLSSELMAWAEEANARKFCAQASNWFDVYVVIYLRRQDNIIMASYNQQIKAGPQKRRIDLIYQKQTERFDYLRILAPWADSLEPGKVIVRPYEREQFHEGDIRRDFMYHTFGMNLDDDFVLNRDNFNPSLSLAAGEYKRMINNLVSDGRKNERFNQLMMQYAADQNNASSTSFSSQSVLSPTQRIEILDATRQASTTIAKRFLGREDGRLFYEPEPQANDPWSGLDLPRQEAAAISRYLEQQDKKLMRWLSEQIFANKDNLAYQIRHSARFLSQSVLSETEAAPVYRVAKEDSSPIVIGGLGGSGTRLVVNLLRKMGVTFGGQMNESLDNLWFSLLFVRRSILLMSDDELNKLAWLFANAMRHGVEVSTELRSMLEKACNSDRDPVLSAADLKEAQKSLLASPPVDRRHEHWGWKQPNAHILLPMLDQQFPEMKFIYVVRNGLDMAFSENQNQLKYFWGDLLLDGDISVTPANALRYWVASHKRMQGFRERMGHRLYFLSFDRLCSEPRSELEALREFLGIQVSKEKLAALAEGVSPPATTNRFLQHDLSQFDTADVDFVRELGFRVE